MRCSAEIFVAAVISMFSAVVPAFSQDLSNWGNSSMPLSHSTPVSSTDPAFSSQSGRINGTVTALDGKPQYDVRVELHDASTGKLVAAVNTGVAGSFSIEMVPYGRYEVIATRGIATLRQDVEVRDSFSTVNLRIDTSNPNDAATEDGLVSVAELRVPRRARDAYLKAKQEVLKNHPEKASSYLEKALQSYSAYAPTLTLRGLLSLDNNDASAAVEDFDSAIHADSTYALAYSAMAKAFNRLHKFDEALRAAERASSLAPNSWLPYFEMAKSYLAKTDFPRALQQLTHAQNQLRQDYAPIHFVRASALLGLKNYQDAAVELTSFLKLAPKNDPNTATAQDALTQIATFVASGSSNF